LRLVAIRLIGFSSGKQKMNFVTYLKI